MHGTLQTMLLFWGKKESGLIRGVCLLRAKSELLVLDWELVWLRPSELLLVRLLSWEFLHP